MPEIGNDGGLVFPGVPFPCTWVAQDGSRSELRAPVDVWRKVLGCGHGLLATAVYGSVLVGPVSVPVCTVCRSAFLWRAMEGVR